MDSTASATSSPGTDILIVKTAPRHSRVREYRFGWHDGAWAPRPGPPTGHAVEYARKQVDGAVLDRRLAEGQTRLSDFTESVDDRAKVHVVA